MLRLALSLALAVIAIVGPTQIASFVHKSVVDGGTDSAVATDDIAPVAAKVAALSPASKVVWADMFHACATSLRADSAAEPAVLRTLESMRRFHVAVGRFAWKAVGGNASDPELAAALEKLFSARFGDADRFLTADDREQLAATYDSLAALAK